MEAEDTDIDLEGVDVGTETSESIESSTSDKMSGAEAIKALNERLGITDRDSLLNSHELKSVDELLENSRREFERFTKEISTKKAEVEKAETAMRDCVETSRGDLTDRKTAESLGNFENTLKSMENLVGAGKGIMQKLYDAIGQTDLIDPDVIQSAAKIIEAVRVSLADVIAFHSTKFQLEFGFRQQVEMENLKQMHRLEIEERKSEIRMKELRLKQQLKDESDSLKAMAASGGEVPVSDGGGGQQWNQSQIMEMMRKALSISPTES